ncbi:MAG: hypothetical protein LBS55_08220 [Prevotellaceae bacterium]|jgi:hypothetical protein|nr:hypothetical protein [Prevotellaceae bacterium]
MTTSSKNTENKRTFTPEDNKRYAKMREIMISSWNKPATWSNDKFHWDAFKKL